MTVTSQQTEFITLAKGEAIITRDCVLDAELNHWRAQPGFPAVTDICGNVAGHVLEFTPEQAVIAAARFTEFSTLLVSLAARAAAYRGGAR